MSNVSFSGEDKIIQITKEPIAGLVDLDVKADIYSAWKEWMLLSDNSKFEPAMRAVGGDPISSMKNLGATFFLINGWRIRPYEANHRLVLTGNLFTDPPGDSPVVSTVGYYNVVVEYFISNLTDSVSADLGDVATAVWDKPLDSPAPGTYGEAIKKIKATTMLIPGL